MDISKYKKRLEPLLKPYNIIIFVIAIVLFIVGIIVLIQRSSSGEVGTISPNQIKIQKGEKIILIDSNGLIEYRTPDGVFYETWNSDQIQIFFDLMREKAKHYLENPVEPSESGYYVTLYIDGKEVTVFIPDDELLDELFEEFEEGGGDDTDLDDFVDDFFNGDDGGNGGETGTTVTPTFTPTPTPIQTGGGDIDEHEYGLYNCTLYEQDVTGRTVISNTLCVSPPED